MSHVHVSPWPQEPQQWHLCAQQPQSAIDLLAEHSSFSRNQLKQLLHNGAVWLENSHGISRCRRAKKALQAGHQLHLYYDPKVQLQQPLRAELIADEGDFSVWNKPAGMLSQGSKWGDHTTLYRFAETHLQPQRQAFLVHRLDQATSGLMVLAHSKQSCRELSQSFAQRRVKKFYRARTQGLLKLDDLPFDVKTALDGKASHSRIVALRQDREMQQSEILIELLSGRKHQIRRHLAALGYPLLGDSRYGSASIGSDLALCSCRLGFEYQQQYYEFQLPN